MQIRALAESDWHVDVAWPVGCYRGKRPQALYRLGCNIVPVHFFEPQRHSQIFFRRAV